MTQFSALEFRRDEGFQDLLLTSAEIEMTFFQHNGITRDSINAIHTSESGKVTHFTIIIEDDERRKQFRNGLGAHIQSLFEDRCNEAFARRDRGEVEDADTPEANVPAVKAVVLGGWTNSSSKIFLLAKWGWKNKNGETIQDGWAPNRT